MSIRRVVDVFLIVVIVEYKDNLDVFVWVIKVRYKDFNFGDFMYFECLLVVWREEIFVFKVLMLVLVGWMDAGMVEGVLLRL